MSGRLEVKTYQCNRCSWESEPKTVFSFETPVFTCDLCGAKCSSAGENNKIDSEDIIVDDEPIVIINSDDEEIDEDWDKNVKNGFDLSGKKNPPKKQRPPQDDSKVPASFQDSFASSVKTFQERQREQAEQLRKMWNLGGSDKKSEPPKVASPVKVERTPYVPPRPNGIIVPSPIDLKVICDPPKPFVIQDSLSDLTPEDLRITCDPPNPPKQEKMEVQDQMDELDKVRLNLGLPLNPPKKDKIDELEKARRNLGLPPNPPKQEKMEEPDQMDELDKVRRNLGLPVNPPKRDKMDELEKARRNLGLPPNPPKPGQNLGPKQSPADFRAAWNSKNNVQNLSSGGPSPSKGPSPAEFRAAWNRSEVKALAGQKTPVKTGGQHGQNVLTDYEEAEKRKEEAARFREEWNKKNVQVGETPAIGQNALQVQSELQVQIYQCEHCGWESEPKTVFASTENSYSTCDLCGFRSVKKPRNDLSKYNYNVRMEEHNKMLLERHTDPLVQARMLQYQEERKIKNQQRKLAGGGGTGYISEKKANTPAGLLQSLYGNANAVNAPVATSFYVNDLLREDNTEVVIDVDEQDDENNEEEEKEDPEEEKTEEPPADNEKRPPKNWESAVPAGFPQGWLWKRTNAWSRRIKVMSANGKVFNWRNAAVAHMEEQYPYVYTRVQIDRAKNWEDKDWREKHEKLEVEGS